MKLFLGLVAYLLVTLPVSSADNSTLSDAVAGLPSCAVCSSVLVFSPQTKSILIRLSV